MNELEQISFYLGRAYYTYVGLLERVLVEMGLDQHIRPGMGNVLFALFEQDDRTISEVGQRLQLSRSTMTGMVAGIEKAGLITTRRDPVDGRAVRLKLTPLARSLEQRCREVPDRIEKVLCRRCDAEKQMILKEVLATMIESMSEEVRRIDLREGKVRTR